jgi:hypothetical protein
MTMITRCEIDVAMNDLAKTKQLVASLMEFPHYAKITPLGVMAIVQKAKSIGMNPLDALNGGMYFVQGKVELSGQAMLCMIRQQGHSVQIDPKTTQTMAILHGKRKDTGDCWTTTFSVEDAKRANIYKGAWITYPQSMCIWRCVSQLGRYLFSDILKGCYVDGEISNEPQETHPDPIAMSDAVVVEPPKLIITEEQYEVLNDLIGEDEEYRQKLLAFLKGKLNIDSLREMPAEQYKKYLVSAHNNNEKKKKQVSEFVTVEEIAKNEEGKDEDTES